MLEQFLQANLWAYLVILTRIGSMVSMWPGFSTSYISARYRIGLAMAISLIIMPAVAPLVPTLPVSAVALALVLFGEVIIGAFFAVIAIVMMSVLQAAGTFIAYFAAMANALVQDAVAGQQSSVISGFLTTVALVLIFVTNTHHLVLRALTDSFALFPPGDAIMFGDMSDILARKVADAFGLGLKLASPMLVVAMIYYLSLGVLGRLMPTLQVFFFGLPAQITAQLIVMALSLSGMMMVFLQAYTDAYIPFLRP